jgi:type I restriction enzyme S subunit
MSNSLPSDWEVSNLGDVAKWGSGGTPKSGTAAFYGGPIMWAVIGDLTESWVSETAQSITKLGLEKSSAKVISSGTVMLAMYGASIGRTGIAAVEMATNQAIAFAVPHAEILDTQYLLKYLQSQKEDFVRAGQGGAQPNISQTVIKSWPIPVPPLQEQKKIVEILEEQLSRLDASLASVHSMREKSARFRRSLLYAAFSGALTDKSLDSKTSPAGWNQCVLADVVNLKSGFAYKSQDWVENGVAVIKIANVRNGKVTLDGCSYVTDEVAGETADFEVLDGHLLMTLTGEIGAIGIYKEHRPARLNQRVARIDLKKQGEHFFRYLCLFLESPQARDLMWSKAQGMAQPNISPKEVLQIPFPLAPSNEQVKIVEILEEQLSRLDAALALADSIEKKASAFRRSLLYAAFAGDLTKEWREAAYV